MSCPVCGKLNCSFLAKLEAQMVTSESMMRRRGGDMEMFTADKEYCLTADGRLCEAVDKAAATVLVHKGGTLKLSDAIKYGLVVAHAVVQVESESDKSQPSGSQSSKKKNLDLRKAGSGAARLKHRPGAG